MKARINSGHQRHPKTKVASPAKPSQTKVQTGFQALANLNSSGGRQQIPHDRGATSTPHVYGRSAGKRRMF